MPGPPCMVLVVVLFLFLFCFNIVLQDENDEHCEDRNGGVSTLIQSQSMATKPSLIAETKDTSNSLRCSFLHPVGA